MTETLNPCSSCEKCWLQSTAVTVGANYDSGKLTRSEASDKISKISQKANQAGCPSSKIQTFRDPLSRINNSFQRYRAITIIHNPTTIADVYERDQANGYYDNLAGMKGFRRGRRTVGR